MENPCNELLENKFKSFGYETDVGCDICGAKPARIEPRFLYISCKHHSHINPIRFKELIEAKKEL